MAQMNTVIAKVEEGGRDDYGIAVPVADAADFLRKKVACNDSIAKHPVAVAAAESLLA